MSLVYFDRATRRPRPLHKSSCDSSTCEGCNAGGFWGYTRDEETDTVGKSMVENLKRIEEIISAHWTSDLSEVEKEAFDLFCWSSEEWAKSSKSASRPGNCGVPKKTLAKGWARAFVQSCVTAAEIGISLRELSKKSQRDVHTLLARKRSDRAMRQANLEGIR